jgi:hypothetical protein
VLSGRGLRNGPISRPGSPTDCVCYHVCYENISNEAALIIAGQLQKKNHKVLRLCNGLYFYNTKHCVFIYVINFEEIKYKKTLESVSEKICRIIQSTFSLDCGSDLRWMQYQPSNL